MMRLDEVRLDPGWDHAASSSSSSGSERRRAAMPASTSFKVGADAVMVEIVESSKENKAKGGVLFSER